MLFELTADHQAVIDRARAIADEVLRPAARDRDRDETFPMAEARVLAKAGLMGVASPAEYGGSGQGAIEYALAIHEIAAACASTAVTMAVTNMVGEMIVKFGTEDQQARFLPLLNGGDSPVGSFCLSEPHSGSDAAALSAKAVRDGDDWILNGTKMWVTSGAHCSVGLVMARTVSSGPPAPTRPPNRAKGITTFLIHRDNPGYIPNKAEDKMGLRGSNTAAITLEDCRVPNSDVLGEEGDGFKVAMTALDGGRVGIGSQALGIARSAMQLAVKLAGPQPSQAQQFRIADMATRFDAGWLMVQRAAYLRAKGTRMTRQAAMAKVYATEAANTIAELALQTAGPEGLLSANDIERYLRDVRVTRIYEGTSEIQRLVIARELLRGM